MHRKAAELMAMWHGIPACFVAKALTALGRGHDWQRSSKTLMADCLANDRHYRDNYEGVDMKAVADDARRRMNEAEARTARKTMAEARAETRNKLLATLSLSEARAKLVKLAKSADGQTLCIGTPEWDLIKKTARRICADDCERADIKSYVDQYLGMKRLIDMKKGAQHDPA